MNQKVAEEDPYRRHDQTHKYMRKAILRFYGDVPNHVRGWEHHLPIMVIVPAFRQTLPTIAND
jgi:hypothetical protein